MLDIKYVDGGNAVYPQGDGLKYIIHCVNDIGAFGAGFVLAIDNKWPIVKRRYQQWSRDDIRGSFKLGQIQIVDVEPEIAVVNMIGQRGVGKSTITVGSTTNDLWPIRYEAIQECLMRVASLAKENCASIHCPKFGSGLAMGDWKHIEELIKDNISSHNISVTVYNYL